MAKTQAEPRALSLIREEHDAINALFDDFMAAGEDRRREIVDEAILRLDIHAQLKDEILYPALEEALGEDAVAEQIGRHEDVEEALDDFVDADEEGPDDEAFEELGVKMKEHFAEEERALADLTRNTEIDLDLLGKEMETRREELRAELSENGDADE
jgi:hypothetical protein